MYQFFVEEGQVSEQNIVITGKDHNHIQNVLRMKSGEKIRISTDTGNSYFCHIVKITPEKVIAVIDEPDSQGTELPNRITLFQGIPKGDKMELIIQKAVELGVYEIIPVAMQNCVVKLDAKKAEARVRRWQAIAESAAKQSKRTVIPRIHMPADWKEALFLAKELDIMLVPYENERGMEATRAMIGSIESKQTIGIMIGPEGGFADQEIGQLSEKMHKISLGRRILRTETAGLAVLSMLVYALEDS